MLAPQRGLIAIVKNKKPSFQYHRPLTLPFDMAPNLLLEMLRPLTLKDSRLGALKCRIGTYNREVFLFHGGSDKFSQLPIR